MLSNLSLSNFINSKISWGDAMIEPVSNLTVMSETGIDNLSSKPSNLWFDKASVSKLRKTFVNMEPVIEEPMAVVGPIVEISQPVENSTVVLDNNHPTVVAYINADRLCSTIWHEKVALEKVLKTVTDKKSLRIEITNILKRWLVASESRFAAMDAVEAIGYFDFEASFKQLYPEEGERNHCVDMINAYYTVRNRVYPKKQKK